MKGFENIVQDLIRAAVEDVINKKVAEVQNELQAIRAALKAPDNNSISKNNFMTLEEVSEFLKRSKQTIYRYRRQGKLMGKLIGGKLLYSHEEVENFMSSKK